jgi:Uma2 family endonuclease
MRFVIDDAFLPVRLTAAPMTDHEFAEFCAQYPDYFIEMSADGELLIMAPNYSRTAAQCAEILRQLGNWNLEQEGGVVTDGTGGFALPSGARRSPDAAWTANARFETMDSAFDEKFWHLCPDFLIEVRSQTDRLPVLRAKMREWIVNGAQLGWLLDPQRRAIEIYRPDRDPEVQEDPVSIEGEGPVAGFVLHLRPVWEAGPTRGKSAQTNPRPT